MERCFVIQTLGSDDFDNRYNDIFKSAIEECGFKPYRISKGHNTSISINQIEQKIRDSKIVFAELTTDDPNVWFELGYAIACKKDVVFVCSNERKEKFPFELEHRNILKYQVDSRNTYEEFHKNIVKEIKALLGKQTPKDEVDLSILKDIAALTDCEIAALSVLLENQI